MTMKAKIYKMEIAVYDFDNRSEQDIVEEIENTMKYLITKVKSSKCIEVEWHDDHPLNKKISETEFDVYFADIRK
jgi:hypothetical protein